MNKSQTQRQQKLPITVSKNSGGHGARTRNRFPGTTFPVLR